ncbi:hypothetical protein SAMN05443248_4621 [Bradyrhizobium erythrophlei]|uniref:Uncharacterized protein n=1 Tax=Bradyrhizobium erythrophlei TaxID=1437360 RepID=A0A1M5SID8_9BRAD|nr:hypothetical protein SAMN05443248_4621 [Bradyrhizobium erythrophlei]
MRATIPPTTLTFCPTIRLRSLLRSPLLSHTITPALGLCSIPPYPPAGSSPALGLGGPAVHHPKQGKGRRNRDGIDLIRLNAVLIVNDQPFSPIASHPLPSLLHSPRHALPLPDRTDTAARALAHRRLSDGLCIPCASRPPIDCVRMPLKPLQDSEMQHQRHLSDDQREGLYGRSEATVTVWDARGRASDQASERSRNVGFGDICRVARPSRPGGVGGGRNLLGRPIIDVDTGARGPVSQLVFGFPEIPRARSGLQNLGRSGSEKSGGADFSKSGSLR